MDGNLLAQTVTQNDINGNSGYYKFDNLSPGSYRVGFSDLPAGYSATGINTVSDFVITSYSIHYTKLYDKVKFDIPTGYKLSPNESGSNTAIDSNPTDNGDTTATTPVFFLESGEVNLSVDMGVYLGHIGNLVWHDINADGIKDAGESVISGLTVKLYKDGATTPLKTTTTNSSGIYSFNDLFPGDYVVEVLKGTYNKFSPFTATDKATDNINDVDNATGKTTSFTISAGERIDTIDAGLYVITSYSIHYTKLYDARANTCLKKTPVAVHVPGFSSQFSLLSGSRLS